MELRSGTLEKYLRPPETAQSVAESWNSPPRRSWSLRTTTALDFAFAVLGHLFEHYAENVQRAEEPWLVEDPGRRMLPRHRLETCRTSCCPRLVIVK